LYGNLTTGEVEEAEIVADNDCPLAHPQRNRSWARSPICPRDRGARAVGAQRPVEGVRTRGIGTRRQDKIQSQRSLQDAPSSTILDVVGTRLRLPWSFLFPLPFRSFVTTPGLTPPLKSRLHISQIVTTLPLSFCSFFLIFKARCWGIYSFGSTPVNG
jgi:hypothetical protein